MLYRIKIASLKTQPATHCVENKLTQDCPMRGSQFPQQATFAKDSRVGTKIIQAAITNGQQTQLIQVWIVESPAATQITQQAVADDVAQSALRFLPSQTHQLGCAQVLSQSGFIQPIKSECLEHGICQLFFAKLTATVLQRTNQT
ncbi:hypothetical protein D3C85_1331940 [compost metagenome]